MRVEVLGGRRPTLKALGAIWPENGVVVAHAQGRRLHTTGRDVPLKSLTASEPADSSVSVRLLSPVEAACLVHDGKLAVFRVEGESLVQVDEDAVAAALAVNKHSYMAYRQLVSQGRSVVSGFEPAPSIDENTLQDFQSIKAHANEIWLALQASEAETAPAVSPVFSTRDEESMAVKTAAGNVPVFTVMSWSSVESLTPTLPQRAVVCVVSSVAGGDVVVLDFSLLV